MMSRSDGVHAMKHFRGYSMRLLGVALSIAGLMVPLAAGPAVAQDEPKVTIVPDVVAVVGEHDFVITAEGFTGTVTFIFCHSGAQQSGCDPAEPRTTFLNVPEDENGRYQISYSVPKQGIVVIANDQDETSAQVEVLTAAVLAEKVNVAASDSEGHAGAAKGHAGDAADHAGTAEGHAGAAKGHAGDAADHAGTAEGHAGAAQAHAGDAESHAGEAQGSAGDAQEAATSAGVANAEAKAAAQAAAASAATAAAVVEAADTSSAGTLAAVFGLVAILLTGGFVASLRRQQRISSERLGEMRRQLEMAHAGLDEKVTSALNEVNAELVVRDTGSGRSADAYEGLRKQVVAASNDRRKHVADLAQIDHALSRTDNLDDLRDLSAEWLNAAGIEKLANISEDNVRAFEVVGDGAGPLMVVAPAYLVSETGQIARQGRAYRTEAEDSSIDNPETED